MSTHEPAIRCITCRADISPSAAYQHAGHLVATRDGLSAQPPSEVTDVTFPAIRVALRDPELTVLRIAGGPNRTLRSIATKINTARRDSVMVELEDIDAGTLWVNPDSIDIIAAEHPDAAT